MDTGWDDALLFHMRPEPIEAEDLLLVLRDGFGGGRSLTMPASVGFQVAQAGSLGGRRHKLLREPVLDQPQPWCIRRKQGETALDVSLAMPTLRNVSK